MTKKTLFILSLSLFILLFACTQAPVVHKAPPTKAPAEKATPIKAEKSEAPAEHGPKNIILMIGDGMGVSQVTAGKVAAGTLSLEAFPVGGLMSTWADPEFVTDSAASGTALATGYKSFNGAISVYKDGRPLRTVSEEAMSRGMKAGVVSTSSVVHATPAVFLSHVDDRGRYFEIAAQMAASGADLIMGGGTEFFLPESEEGGGREDEKNLAKLWESSGGCFFTALGDPEADMPDCPKRLFLFAENHMPARLDGREPSLPEMTDYALKFLARDDTGFFLMVEGSQIDWAAHDHDAEYLVDEVLDFDEAVGRALAFAKADGNTLLIVTADHETGGMAVSDGDLSIKTFEADWTTGGHTAAMVPLFAFGPGAESFGGMHDNAEVGKMLREALPKKEQ